MKKDIKNITEFKQKVSASVYIKDYNFDHYNENDFIEITEWGNKLGYDILINVNSEERVISLTKEEFDIIIKLREAVDHFYDEIGIEETNDNKEPTNIVFIKPERELEQNETVKGLMHIQKGDSFGFFYVLEKWISASSPESITIGSIIDSDLMNNKKI